MRSEILFLILGMGVATYLTRFGFIYMYRYIKAPHKLNRWLKHVPTSILTALIVPTLVLPEGYINLSFNNSYLCAGMVAAVIAWKTRNIFITLFSGMAVMLLYIFFNP